MGLRPGKCYRFPHKPAYTRLAIKVNRKNFVGTAPGVKTRQFNMGNPIKQFSHIFDLVAEESMQVRDNALESARMAVNRQLAKGVGKEEYFLKIRVFPYQVLRENKQAQGAGADRVTKGMSHAFGKPIGRAVRVRPGTKIMSVLADGEKIEETKKALKRAYAKLPCKLSIRIGTDIESIGTKPKKARFEEEKEEKKEGAAEEAKPAEGKAAEKGKEEKGKEEKKEELKKEERKKK